MLFMSVMTEWDATVQVVIDVKRVKRQATFLTFDPNNNLRITSLRQSNCNITGCYE
jgi:hypothetical protein